MLECMFKRARHTLFHSMIASEMLCLRLSFVGEGHKGNYITNNAKLSFLARTRNIFVGAV